MNRGYIEYEFNLYLQSPQNTETFFTEVHMHIVYSKPCQPPRVFNRSLLVFYKHPLQMFKFFFVSRKLLIDNLIQQPLACETSKN